MISRLPGENLKKLLYFYELFALCKFGHRELDIPKKLLQLEASNLVYNLVKFCFKKRLFFF